MSLFSCWSLPHRNHFTSESSKDNTYVSINLLKDMTTCATTAAAPEYNYQPFHSGCGIIRGVDTLNARSIMRSAFNAALLI